MRKIMMAALAASALASAVAPTAASAQSARELEGSKNSGACRPDLIHCPCG